MAISPIGDTYGIASTQIFVADSDRRMVCREASCAFRSSKKKSMKAMSSSGDRSTPSLRRSIGLHDHSGLQMRHDRELHRLSEPKAPHAYGRPTGRCQFTEKPEVRQDFALLAGKAQYGRSNQYLVSHAAVRTRADVLFGIKVIGESGIDLARLVECFYLFR